MPRRYSIAHGRAARSVCGVLYDATAIGNDQDDPPRKALRSTIPSGCPQALCGPNNARLKLIERTAGVPKLHLRGNEVAIEGDDAAVDIATSALEQLYALALSGKPLGSDDIVRAVKLLQGDTGRRRHDRANVFGDTILTPRSGRPIAPKGASQKKYVDLVRSNDVVFAVGPAGTGKTYLAMALAVRALLDKQVRRLVLTRPAVEAGEHLGFLPGTLEEKIDPYLRPLFDALARHARARSASRR